MKLKDLNENENITIIAKSDANELKFKAIIIRILKENTAIIEVQSEENHRLNFDNVQLNIEYTPKDSAPIIWRSARVLYVKNKYILQVAGDGVKYNRRSCFRLPLSKKVNINLLGSENYNVILKDISLSGFSIVDRNNEFDLYIGNDACIRFEDLGYKIKLVGRVVRITEEDNKKVYGFELRNLCRDLSPYITIKQQKNRIQKMKQKN